MESLALLFPRFDLFTSLPHFLLLHVVGEVVEEGDDIVTGGDVVRDSLAGPHHVHEGVRKVTLREVHVTALQLIRVSCERTS